MTFPSSANPGVPVDHGRLRGLEDDDHPQYAATDHSHTDDAAALTDTTGRLVPVGSLVLYTGAAAPTGWLICDGTSLVRTDYPALFNIIGTAFGSADSTHFTLPDLRDRVPVGVSGTIALAATGGSKDAVVVSHDHTQALGGTITTVAPVAGAGVIGQANNQQVSTSGVSGTGKNMQPYVGINYIIKVVA